MSEELWQEVQKWWSKLTSSEQAAWLADRPHVPYVAIGRDGCWGRGQTPKEALKQMRAAGFSGSTKRKVMIYVLPPGLLDGCIDDMGGLTYNHHPVIGRDAKPAKVLL